MQVILEFNSGFKVYFLIILPLTHNYLNNYTKVYQVLNKTHITFDFDYPHQKEPLYAYLCKKTLSIFRLCILL